MEGQRARPVNRAQAGVRRRQRAAAAAAAAAEAPASDGSDGSEVGMLKVAMLCLLYMVLHSGVLLHKSLRDLLVEAPARLRA